MTDKLTPGGRSENMRRIRAKETKPEIEVRKIIHSLGYRYRLHAPELPGKPDIVRRAHRQALFVHGCFWHQHEAAKCLDGRRPKSNKQYWNPKLDGNVARDRRNVAALKRAGWRVLIVWDCELKRPDKLTAKLTRFLST